MNTTSASYYGTKANLIDQNGSQTTTFKFNGTEDLGGGMKANFRFEIQPRFHVGNGNAFDAAPGSNAAVVANGTAQTTGNGQASLQSGMRGNGWSYIQLQGGFGDVKLGTLNTEALYSLVVGTLGFQQGQGTGIGSGYDTSLWANTTRYESAAQYTTPTFNGLSGSVLYRPGQATQYGKTTGFVLRRDTVGEYAVKYLNGPLEARAAKLTVKSSPNEAAASATAAAASSVTTSTTALGASYDLGVARLGYALQKQINDAGSTTTPTAMALSIKAQGLFAVVPYQNMRFLVAGGKRTTNSGTTASSATSLAGLTTSYTSWGAHYDLSKRTYLYYLAENATANDLAFSGIVSNGAALTAATFTDKVRKVQAIGVSHSF